MRVRSPCPGHARLLVTSCTVSRAKVRMIKAIHNLRRTFAQMARVAARGHWCVGVACAGPGNSRLLVTCLAVARSVYRMIEAVHKLGRPITGVASSTSHGRGRMRVTSIGPSYIGLFVTSVTISGSELRMIKALDHLSGPVIHMT